jgi:hypothetical protein
MVILLSALVTNAVGAPCQDGQEVVYNGLTSKFICKDTGPSLPTCPSGQFLTSSDGKTFTCQPIGVPPCPTGKVLTFLSGSGFTCINPNAPVPDCNGTNQFLTYSQASNTFSCASVTQPGALPVCASGQVLTSTDGKTFTCVAAPATYGQCTWYCENNIDYCLTTTQGMAGVPYHAVQVDHGIIVTPAAAAGGNGTTAQCDNGTWIVSGCGSNCSGPTGDNAPEGDSGGP